MLICPKCNKELEDGVKFCDTCGAQIFETIFCPNCGEKTSTEFAFCEQCGASIKEDVTIKAISEKENSNKKLIEEIKSLPKKWLLGISGGIVIVVLIIIFIGQALIGGGNKNYCLYVKDEEIVYDDFSDEGVFELTSRLYDSQSDVELGINDEYMISYYVKVSKDGKYVFYPDRLENEMQGCTLYCRNVNKPKEDPIKVDSEVTYYEINDAGTKVIYLKEDGLYLNDLEDKEKIANDVKNVLYVSENLGTVYYESEEGLYKNVIGEDDVTKIASDVNYVEKIYDSGEIYYTKEEIEEVKLIDYVTDDIAEADAAMTRPERPEYPYWWHYDTDEEYETAKEQYDVAKAQYEIAYEAYEAKLQRDELRESLQESTFEKSVYTLYYYDGKESFTVSDALTDYILPFAQERPTIIYCAYNQVETPKVKLSEITSADEVENLVSAAMYSSAERYLAVGTQTSIVEQANAQMFRFTDDGKILYFLDNVDEETGDLYKAAISGASIQKPELIDDEVDNTGIYYEKNTIAYFKNCDYEKDRGDLWINGKEVDYDVCNYRIELQDGIIYYYSDWNDDKAYGTFKMYKKGNTTKIADDVYSAHINEEKIFYLYDYSVNSSCGTLYMYKNGDSEKISDDVTCIIE